MGGIVNIMASSSAFAGGAAQPASDTSRRLPSHFGAAVIALSVAVVLFVLGLPRLVAGILAAGTSVTLWDMHRGADVADIRTKAADTALAGAERWVEDGETLSDHGYILLHEALVLPLGPGRTTLMAQAEKATVAGLARAPSQPSGWWRLAYLRNQRSDMAGAVRALRLSFLAGAFVPSIMKPRLEFAFRLLPAMDGEMRSLLLRQIRLAWVVEPDFVTGLSARPELAPMVKEALETMSEQDVSAYLQNHRQQP